MTEANQFYYFLRVASVVLLRHCCFFNLCLNFADACQSDVIVKVFMTFVLMSFFKAASTATKALSEQTCNQFQTFESS